MATQEKNTKSKIVKTLANQGSRVPYKASVYEEFILWTAMPPKERDKLGIETQGEFTKHFKIGEGTPTAWKARPDFIARVTELRRQWAFDKTGNVIEGIYISALKGNPFSQKLWLQYFLGFTEKTEVENTNKVEVSINDIRHLINQLPEPLRFKHHANLRELLDDASATANTRDAEDSSWTTRPADTLLGEADHVAQDIPSEPTDEVAESNTCGLCNRMVREVHTYHHQSTARWWKE